MVGYTTGTMQLPRRVRIAFAARATRFTTSTSATISAAAGATMFTSSAVSRHVQHHSCAYRLMA